MFIRLKSTDYPDSSVVVNTQNITHAQPDDDGEATTIYLVGGEEIRVVGDVTQQLERGSANA